MLLESYAMMFDSQKIYIVYNPCTKTPRTPQGRYSASPTDFACGTECFVPFPQWIQETLRFSALDLSGMLPAHVESWKRFEFPFESFLN